MLLHKLSYWFISLTETFATRAQYYDTYYLRNLQMLTVSKSVCPFQAFPGAYLEQNTQKVLQEY